MYIEVRADRQFDSASAGWSTIPVCAVKRTMEERSAGELMDANTGGSWEEEGRCHQNG